MSAGLIGTISGSRVTVENCHVNADVTASESYVGILAGQINQNTAGEISRCSAQGTADGSRGVGGFVGYIVDSGSMWIRDCMVTDAFVHGENEHVGGMFGMSKCGVERCFVKDVTVQQDAPNSGTKFCASLLTGWHNFGSLSINNNVLYSGKCDSSEQYKLSSPGRGKWHPFYRKYNELRPPPLYDNQINPVFLQEQH